MNLTIPSRPRWSRGRMLTSCAAIGIAMGVILAIAWGSERSKPQSSAEITAASTPAPGQESVVRNSRGKIFAARGEPRQALAEFELAIAHEPGRAVLYANRGGAKLQLGNRHGAIADCTRALDIDQRCVEGYLNRAQARKELGDLVGAAEDYSRALEFLAHADRLRGPVTRRLDELRRMNPSLR